MIPARAPLLADSASGVLFSFEGIDGSGKTTQARRLAAALETRGREVVLLREPGGTTLGEELRSCLLRAREPAPCTEAELLLFGAARAQLVRERILPALRSGAIVVLDRYVDATAAYQGHGRGLDAAFLAALQEFATGGVLPARTWFLDLPVASCAARREARGEAKDRMESESDGFRERVRQGYLAQAAAHPDRIRIVAADGAEEAIAAEILNDALACLSRSIGTPSPTARRSGIPNLAGDGEEADPCASRPHVVD